MGWRSKHAIKRVLSFAKVGESRPLVHSRANLLLFSKFQLEARYGTEVWLVHASRCVSPFLNADQKVAFHDERCIFKYLPGFSHLRFRNNPIYHPTGFTSRFKNANSPTLRSVVCPRGSKIDETSSRRVEE